MINLHAIDQHRDWAWERSMGMVGDHLMGCFTYPSVTDRKRLRAVVSNDAGWDHVSISRRDRCPNWDEMEQTKRLFFEPDETAMQLHVPETDHVNNHPYCLHLWRPHDTPIPRPPAVLVGVAGITPDDLRRMSHTDRMAMRFAASRELK